MNDDHRALWEKLRHFRFGMLTTVDDQHQQLRSRPLTNQDIEFDGTLWFLTSDTTSTYREIDRDHLVNVSYADPDRGLFVSVSGHGRLLRDREKAATLWNPLYKAFFPEGLDDPHLVLLKVEVTEAEYWDSPAGPVRQLYRLAKSAVTGEPPYDDTEHRRIDTL
ncbi:pyridoxamine 5'-phosphate oxidase family protein [Chitinolyticbacter meiyuanensis]|uniref:pyridoxamine 5'-phosphate oxidase family protein n=1 Tax=Chitinolyticbacter meiyuanensis TaxID=682798 RepID=UPI0011E59795|nr:pyridoxamine 5'-phosphate oxidase family protein [Chitinolyticbacter meiyuanensis]